ncbi:MFS transporter [Terasakiella sp. SH-1]|uniref:MFS transporter n=1 Tax=Terasakiella sp. SH-1 TaxID=2560057 RepID=UPI001F10D3FF|nr:MFS transporter [Terasakiella sp. SH-1]
MGKRAWTIIICGALILAIGMGMRQNHGLFIEPMRMDLGWQLGVFAMALAVQNLMWGVAQPFAGALADKYGSRPVLLGGVFVYVLGLLGMAFPQGPMMLHMSAGVLVGLGVAAMGLPVVLGAVARMVSEEKRSTALGIASMGGSFGQFLFAPVSQGLINEYGWSIALTALAAIAALGVFLALQVNAKPNEEEFHPNQAAQTLSQAIHEAFGTNSYILLNLGFFVCGFHIAFIVTHLPMFLSTCNIAPEVGATALAVIGVSNMAGTYLAGVLGGKYSKKYLLSLIYLSRALAILVYMLMPVTVFSTLAFSVAMGALWLSTVPLTSGLVGVMFGTRYMGTLFAITLFTHQVGAFFGAWLGGYFFDLTGSFDGAWIASIALGVFSAVVHLPIKEVAVERATQAA